MRKEPPGFRVVSLDGVWFILVARYNEHGVVQDAELARSPNGAPITRWARKDAIDAIEYARIALEVAELRAENARLRALSAS